jgi:hypothetical protein
VGNQEAGKFEQKLFIYLNLTRSTRFQMMKHVVRLLDM